MKLRKSLACLFAMIVLGASLGRAETKPAAAFDKLKGLVGEWEAKFPEGNTGRVTYRLTSGGSALVETIMPGEAGELVTIYHPDGGDAVLTHYCLAQNQPRMRAKAPAGDPRELTFDFVDVSNLSSPSAMHMRDLVITFVDADHMTQRWNYRQDGRDSPNLIQLTRKK